MDPLVTCVLLTADRPAMTARAVKSFLAQTYERKALLIFDSGKELFQIDRTFRGHLWVPAEEWRGASIGALRNRANECARGADIIAHWDSDDWSHPYRLAEQVNLLQASRADAVGYHDMLFWQSGVYGGSAHLYRYSPGRDASKYALGTSLLYWRRTWERIKFDDPGLERAQAERAGAGEDNRWIKKINCLGVKGVEQVVGKDIFPDWQPRMIAEIHGGNLVQQPGDLAGDNFTQVPEWDGYCRDRMAL